MKIAGFPNFARYESSFAIIDDQQSANSLTYYTIDEERLLREKHTYTFPLLAMDYCLDQAGISNLSKVDLVVTDYSRRQSLYNDGPGYRKTEHDYLKSILKIDRKKLLIVNHHDAHAAGVFYPSNYSEAAVIVVDGMGSDLETQSIYYGDPDGLRCIEKGSGWGIGGLYTALTNLIGFTGHTGVDLAGKTMGLAPLGRDLNSNIVGIDPTYNGAELDYSKTISRFPKPALTNTDLVPCMDKNDVTSDYYKGIAFEVQQETENAVIHLAKRAYELTKCENICITGGVALNSVANGKIKQLNGRIWTIKKETDEKLNSIDTLNNAELYKFFAERYRQYLDSIGSTSSETGN